MKSVHACMFFMCLSSWYCTTTVSMDPALKCLPKDIPATHLNRTLVNSLRNKNSDVFYDYRHESSTLANHENQNIFYHKTAFADSQVNAQEELYASYNTQQQKEFVEMFACVMKKITTLKTSHAPQKEIEDCIALSYHKLSPLVWRVHLLWFLRKQTSDMFGDALAEIFGCAPCIWGVANAFGALILAASYYFTLLYKMPWPENTALASFFPFICVVSGLYDLAYTPLNKYSQSQAFIRKKFKKFTMWKKITDDLARTMEETYKPL